MPGSGIYCRQVTAAVVAAGAAVTFTGCRRYQGLLSEPGQVLPPHLVTAGWTLARVKLICRI